LRDESGKEHLIGILKEKRENLLRITGESVPNLGIKVIGRSEDVANIHFIQVEV